MRVHELAKATQLESKEVIAIAKKHRIAIKPSPSANVEDKDIRKMMPLIDKYKSEQQVQAAEERKKKEEERQRKEEERRRKDEERKKVAEVKAKSDDIARSKAEEEARNAEKQRRVDERKAREQAQRMEKEEEARRRQEDERLRSLGIPIPKRPANFRPRIAPPPPPPAPRAPAPAPRPAAPREGASPQGQRPRTDAPGGQQRFQPRPPGAEGTRPARPAGAPGDRAPRPGGYQGNQGAPRQGGYQGGGGQQGAPRPGGYQGTPGAPRQGGYQGGGGQQGAPRTGGYQGNNPRPGGYQGGQGGQGGAPRTGGYQGNNPRPGGGYQGNQQGGAPRTGGYQGNNPRPAGGYQGGQGGQRPGGPPRPGAPRGGAPGSRETGFSGALSESNLPTIGVMRLDKPQGRRGEKEVRRAADKKPRGKVAPRKIFELDEDMTITTKPKAPTANRPGFNPGFGGRTRFGSRGGRKRPKGSRQNEVRDLGPRIVTVEGPITVSQFADKVGVPATEIIRKVLVDVGEALSMNAILSEELIQLITPDYNVELTIVPVGDEYDVEDYTGEDDPATMVRRPPVVTIMGHVDHGKTSLLDHVRKSKVVSGEFGGITQHIGAYLVSTAKGDIVFLDTPGHEAFTSMRARGAGVTDLVILVVAADDGFMPQTIEAINHSRAAGVPLVVAINKIDLPAADPAKVKQEALQHNLIPEELGGDTIFVEISAKQGLNVDALLEMVALQAEILDLKASPDRAAQGIIIESHLDPNRGAVATVLVQRGTLRVGDHFVTGNISGRVRAMNNDRGKSIKVALPSHPAEIIGLTASPSAGESLVVVPDEQVARSIAERREVRRRATDLAPVTNKHVTLENLHDFIEEGKTRDLNMIIKADVQGSVEAVRQSLEKITSDEIKIRILHTAVGGINESDISLAAASDAIIVGFNVRPDASAQELANQEGVDIKTYRIIYDLIEDVKSAMVGMLSPTFKEKVIGHAEIRQVFRASRLGNIAGCYVKDGEIIRDSKARVLRDNVVVFEGQLSSLRRGKEDVKKVTTGMECGITVHNFNDIKEGDIIEVYQLEQIASTLTSGAPASAKS